MKIKVQLEIINLKTFEYKSIYELEKKSPQILIYILFSYMYKMISNFNSTHLLKRKLDLAKYLRIKYNIFLSYPGSNNMM